jgi:hypothetical protein
MNQPARKILIGDTPQKLPSTTVEGSYVTLLGETFYQIRNYDALEPFFMSIVSSSDHWLFISSSGGLTAGRVNAERALFPYYTEDKLTENSENTGAKSIFLVTRRGQTWLWEPFSARQRGQYTTERNLYKNVPGTALVFEEINPDLGLTVRYAWRTSEQLGFVKTTWLVNDLDTACQVELLDGLQNLLPANVTSQTQNTFSCLLDGYKRSELDPKAGLGIFALNSTLTDLAEPSESLLATTVFQVGLDGDRYLLSSLQLDKFRSGWEIEPETEIRGRRGAYFVHADLGLAPREGRSWHLVADVHQDAAAIVRTLNRLQGGAAALGRVIAEDIADNTVRLRQIVASADGLQVSADPLCTSHHFANVMFNVMRGGVFADQYGFEKADLVEFVSTHHRTLLETHAAFFNNLPSHGQIADLQTRAQASGSADLIRLSYMYLPLTFSRRHGDPSRPWNRFSISLKGPDGSRRLDFEGNWRDIFQNWEALAYSYPEYVEGMIFTFLSATTADGYNPYRITRAGLDWEIPEPGNPWANIGYWSDHQIIYLQKLMELSVKFHPGRLRASLEQPILSYADVPYRIKPFADLQKDPYNSIGFDHALEMEIEARVKTRGTDGKLVCQSDGQVLHHSLAEKLLSLLLAKLVNFVPEGGIWMNTQRPEWNDANNALAGKGLSVVTLGYLRRYVAFCRDLFAQETPASVQVSAEMAQLLTQIAAVLERFQPQLAASFDDTQRYAMLRALGEAGSAFRWDYYKNGFSGQLTSLSGADVLSFLDLAQRYIEHSLRANRRSDHLYHAYNILHLDGEHAKVGHLYEMLEGQVSILSSGMLTGEEALSLLDSLRHSALYRADQHSYILYPDKALPGFLQKNSLTEGQLRGLQLPLTLAEMRETSLFVRDMDGGFHFSGHLRNGKDVRRALEALSRQSQFAELVEAEGKRISSLFEAVFRHSEFTGRSGTFFAYEGLGSIYWHMVSKLLLAVQEIALHYQDAPFAPRLVEAYHDIRAGLGFHKSPAVYGAFPTDPYSHTPKGQGARQPGMTGMVKEEILTRLAEAGLTVEEGCLTFEPLLLDRAELLTAPAIFEHLSVDGTFQHLDLPAGSFAVTFCQVPIMLQSANVDSIAIYFADGGFKAIDGHRLDETTSRSIFQRDGKVHRLVIQFQEV